jgi:hypothetical protein
MVALNILPKKTKDQILRLYQKYKKCVLQEENDEAKMLMDTIDSILIDNFAIN